MSIGGKGKEGGARLGDEVFRLLFETVAEALWLLDEQGFCVAANPAALAMLGYEGEEAQDLLWPALLRDTEPAGLDELWARVVGGEGLTVAGGLKRKDGNVVPVEVQWRPLVYPGGQYIVASVREIKEAQREGETWGAPRARQADAEAGKRANEVLQAIVAEMPVAVVGLDLDGKVDAVWNKAAESMLGWTAAEAIGRFMPTVSIDTEAEFDTFREILRRGETLEGVEVRRQRRDGSSINYRIYASPRRDAAGNINGSIAVLVDSTASQQARVALERSEKKYRSFYESILDGFVCVDMRGNIREANKSYLEMLGYTAEEILTRCYQDITPPRWQEFEANIVAQQILDRGYSDTYEKEYIRKDGTVFPVELQTYLIRDENGAPAGMWAFIKDITERKRTEEALRESEERYRSLFHNNHAVMLLIEPGTGAIVDANRAACEYYGYSREGLLEKNINDFNILSPEQVRREMEAARTERRKRFAFRHRLANGEVRDVEVLSGPIRIQGRELLYSIIHDVTARHRAEEALRESEERLRLALKAANQGLYDLDFQTGVAQVSPEYATMLGYEPGALQETHTAFIERLHPEDRKMVAAKYLAYIRGEVPEYTAEFRQRTQAGEWKWILSQGKIVAWDELGRPQRMLGTHTDITRRKNMEKSLLQTQFAVDRARDPIFWIKDDGSLAYVNQAACAALGYTQEELLALKVFDFDPQIKREQWPEHWRRAREQGASMLETWHRAKDGRTFPVEISINFMEFEGIEYHCDFVRDLTERKRAEAELRESERRWAEIIDFLPDATLAIDLAGRVMAWNRAIEEMTGIAAASIVGKGDYEYALPFYGVRRPILIDLVFQSDAEIERKYAFVRREGDILWAEADVPLKGVQHILWGKARPLYDREGNVVGAIEAIRDITERKRAEEERARLEAQMREVQKLESLGVLAGGIAHDFNNLLMAILGNADLALLSLASSSPARPNVEEIIRASQRAADLCRQMLAYSGKGRFVVGHYDLSEVVREMVQMLEVSVSKKAMLRYSFAGGLPPVEADVTQLRQVIMNLITNASEALGEGSGVIAVSTGVMECTRDYLAEGYLDDNLPGGRYVYLEVIDTGTGMDEETRRRIFDPFFTTKFTGRGLGLAAVLGIVRGHGGAIKIASEPGRGTSFKVLLPAGKWTSAERAANAVQALLVCRGGTVLLVDDDPAVRQVAKQMLERLGFTVVVAKNGREALEVFRERQSEIDCVILDLSMPEMGGEEVFRELRRLRQDVRVILSSGYNEQEVVQHFAGQELAGFVQKPYKMDKLREILQYILGPEEGRGS